MTLPADIEVTSALALLEEIQRRMAGPTDRDEERRILEILSGATPEELDILIQRLDLRALLGDVDDHWFGPQNRAALLDLLAADRLAHLGTGARAALVAALQQGWTPLFAEQAVRRVLLGTRGAALTALKSALDSGRDHHDLHQLLYRDIDDGSLREEILAHFAAEAAPSGEAKILSDIDDTFYANWKDRRYPSKTVYPGVLQFYAELDRGPGDQPGRSGDLTFITARPGDRLGLIEDTTRETLAERGAVTKSVLTGSFHRLLTSRAIAEKKLENFLEYRRLYPEYGFVFIGDSGQGDIHFGQRMRELAPEVVRGVFIHDVVATPGPARRELAAGGVLLFDTYVGAAAEALALGLLHPEGAARVAEAAQSELAALVFPAEAQRLERAAELACDLERLRTLLP
jgi:hypothetical protein